jgi:hypothetical protein
VGSSDEDGDGCECDRDGDGGIDVVRDGKSDGNIYKCPSELLNISDKDTE